MPKMPVVDHNRRSSLYLICPSDYIGQLIEAEFTGDTYFYTALGVYFEFDMDSQLSLWKLVSDKNISHITFITSLHNTFYTEALYDEVNYPCPLTKSLHDTYLSINRNSEVGTYSNNFHLLVYQHLKNQMNRLMNTEYLGKQIEDNNIRLDAIIYQPQHQEFCDLEEIEWKGQLFHQISYN